MTPASLAAAAAAISIAALAHSAGATELRAGHVLASAETTHAERRSEPGTPHWSYSGEGGPKAWGELSAEFQACRTGQFQSPIDISGGVGAASTPIEFDYHLSPLEILHNGHTVQVDYAPGSGIVVEGRRFELLQFHFHSPSEHLVDGQQASMELHLVHRSAGGELAVVAILFENGAENLALREIWQVMPREASQRSKHPRVLINARDLLPAGSHVYRYMGSLTTPPCSEGVNWFVMADPVPASMEQVMAFSTAVGPNARPVQARNHRLVLAPPESN
jgi:carbonic anhydrase